MIAGAGSGKTSTLAHRVAHLIAGGADPQRLLLLTFSRRAAQEMERRAGQVLCSVLGLRSQTPPALPWAGTFHGIGARLLREYAAQIGLDENFTIHDRGDAEDLMGLVRHELGLSSTATKRFPQQGHLPVDLLAHGQHLRAAGRGAERGLSLVRRMGGRAQAAVRRLRRGQAAAAACSTTTTCCSTGPAMVAEPALAAHVGERFDHVLVDEYQDTNLLQAAILLALKPDGRGVTVVGDDAQSIYSFRGATVRNILDFPAQFSQAGAHRHAGAQLPLDAADPRRLELRSSPHAAERHAKTLWTDKPSAGRPQLVLVPDEAQQARWVADRVLAHREGGLALKSQAVLFRTSTHSAALELELARRNIPFVKYGGLKFLEAAHVKDLLAVLRFAQNPRGRMAGFRVTQLIPGIGPATSARLLDAMDRGGRSGRGGAGASCRRRRPGPNGRASPPSTPRCARPRSTWPADMELALDWYLPHLERLHDDAGVRRGDVEQLARLAAGYASRERFLTELTLDPPEATSDRPARRCSTRTT